MGSGRAWSEAGARVVLSEASVQVVNRDDFGFRFLSFGVTWSDAGARVVLIEASAPLSPVWRETSTASPSTELIPARDGESWGLKLRCYQRPSLALG